MLKEMKTHWGDVRAGDVLADGSVVTQRHADHECECIRVTTKDESLALSEDHMLLCDIGRLPKWAKNAVLNECANEIVPVEVDWLIFSENLPAMSDMEKERIFRDIEAGIMPDGFADSASVQEVVVKDEPKIYDPKRWMVWLTTLEIHRLCMQFPGKIRSGGNKVLSTEYAGRKMCCCVSTNTGRYRVNGKCKLSGSTGNNLPSALFRDRNVPTSSYKRLSDDELENMSCSELLIEYQKLSNASAERANKRVENLSAKVVNLSEYKHERGAGVVHHNSVTIRNIIFHCLTHGIKIGLVDLKITEFEEYKGHANVIGVANDVEEACELLRIARQLMYRRNKELAKAGVVDLLDYKPKKKTSRIAVFGREFDEKDTLIARIDGVEKEITFGDLEAMLNKKE